MANTMALAISIPTSSSLHSSSSYAIPKPSLFLSSKSAVSIHKNAIFQHFKCISQLGFSPFPQWNGLKQLGFSISQYSVRKERKGRCKGKGVYASLFGVGAPEALVIGVVALLVFGPKGLAESTWHDLLPCRDSPSTIHNLGRRIGSSRGGFQTEQRGTDPRRDSLFQMVARNFGKTLRSFQPTIRELQEVSREFKSSLEREIGLDEIDYRVPTSSLKPTSYDAAEDSKTNVESSESQQDDSPSESGAYSADEYLKVTEAQLEGALARVQKEKEDKKEKAENQFVSESPSLGVLPETPPKPET